MSDTALALAKELMSKASVTPDDAGCQKILAEHLGNAGFSVTHLPFGDVDNIWATHGTGAPLILFQGHTDVVPPGPLDAWDTDPFEPVIADGQLIGRGACDMKAALAAMAQAAMDYCQVNPDHAGTVAFAATSDEEGPADDGMTRVVDWIKEKNIHVDYCITGEPTSVDQCGDTLKIGRRGSMHGHLIFHGKQGHIAYPHLASNPIHHAMQPIQALTETAWDNGHEEFLPTSLQFFDIQAGTGATNVIPGELRASFNCRYAPCHTPESLQKLITDVLDKLPCSYDITWTVGARSFLSPKGKLLDALCQAIKDVTGLAPVLSTSGGTSDSRFFAELGCEVIDFGPRNATAHQANEYIGVDELHACYEIYHSCLKNLL